MAKINPDMGAQKLHAEREEVWAEARDWYKRQIATDHDLADMLAMYEQLQLGGADLRRAFRAMDDIKLGIVSRLASAAMCEVSYRHYCEARGDDDGE